MTAREAYDTDAVFRALVNEWVDERRCPLPLVDRCLDFDMPAAAECARWAATEPEREIFGGGGQRCGPYPTPDSAAGKRYKPHWYWILVAEDAPVYTADDVPGQPHLFGSDFTNLPTALDAILWLLDNFRPAEASA